MNWTPDHLSGCSSLGSVCSLSPATEEHGQSGPGSLVLTVLFKGGPLEAAALLFSCPHQAPEHSVCKGLHPTCSSRLFHFLHQQQGSLGSHLQVKTIHRPQACREQAYLYCQSQLETSQAEEGAFHGRNAHRSDILEAENSAYSQPEEPQKPAPRISFNPLNYLFLESLTNRDYTCQELQTRPLLGSGC